MILLLIMHVIFGLTAHDRDYSLLTSFDGDTFTKVSTNTDT